MSKSTPKQVIVMRVDTDPKMRKGKMIAQGAHASLAVIFDMMRPYDPENRPFRSTPEIPYGWTELKLHLDNGSPLEEWINGSFVKIVLQGNLSDVVNSYNAAKKVGIPCSLIEDKGLTEFGGKVTITCCAIGPDDPEKIDKITGHLKLL
jgi:peptidyl-tRNA hydrolase, PTH2 family